MKTICLAIACLGFISVVTGGRCKPSAIKFPIVATCALRGLDDPRIQGNVTFTQLSSATEVVVSGNVCNLAAGSLHGLHVHQFGDITGGCLSSGTHYNPFNKTHGDRIARTRHVGDFGNVVTGADGCAQIAFTDFVTSLDPTRIESILARTLVLHSSRDDLGKGNAPDSLTTGNSGARIACCVIGLAKIPEGLLGPARPAPTYSRQYRV